LWAVPASPLGYRDADPPYVPDAVSASYRTHVTRLLTRQQASKRTATLYLTAEARAAWHAVSDRYERQLRPGRDFEGLEEWGAKLAGHAARLAGLLHLADRTDDPTAFETPISVSTVRRAAAITDSLIPHAQRLFASLDEDAPMALAKHVLQKLRSFRGTRISKRDLYQRVRGRRVLSKADDLDPILDLLERHGFVRRRVQPAAKDGGRPRSPEYDINPLEPERHPQNPHKQATRSDSEGSECFEDGNPGRETL